MTEQEFRNKYVGKAVHCDTEEKAKELLKLVEIFGWSPFGDTNWHIHEKDTCYRIGYDKTTGYSSSAFYEAQGWEVVKFESKEKKVTKKVFDLGLFVDDRKECKNSDEEIMEDIKTWALQCHGLTEEEMKEKLCVAFDQWMKEVEVDLQLTAQEIEVLKALKVLGLNWLVRDEDGDLYTHRIKPCKKCIYWSSDSDEFVKIDSSLFTFITWQDEEQTSIDELLDYKNQN